MTRKIRDRVYASLRRHPHYDVVVQAIGRGGATIDNLATRYGMSVRECRRLIADMSTAGICVEDREGRIVHSVDPLWTPRG